MNDSKHNNGPDLSQIWLRHLRQNARPLVLQCRYCKVHKIFRSEEELKIHVRDIHGTEGKDDYEDLEAKHELRPASNVLGSYSIKGRVIGHGRSPSSSVRTTDSTESGQSPKQIRSFNAHNPENREMTRPPIKGKRLFDPDSDSPLPASMTLGIKVSKWLKSSRQHTRTSGQVTNSGQPPLANEPAILRPLEKHSATNKPQKTLLEPLKIVRQPETRLISQDQLVAEVKGIYAGLVMVDAKCIQVDAKQAAISRKVPEGTQPKLNNEQWQALIALHRTLLHEHHDFFLASQQPSATTAVRNLAIKYAMPARLWHHGIHSFLELLRNRLPDLLDHMLAFIYLAYSMMILLYETVLIFKEKWIECLRDLRRYRMAIEDDDIRDREVWTQVAQQWYLKASDRSPKTGRLYHHLEILARPNVLQQLFFYHKALSVPQTFAEAQYRVDAAMNSEYRLERIPWQGCQSIKLEICVCCSDERQEYSVLGPEQMSSPALEPSSVSETEDHQSRLCETKPLFYTGFCDLWKLTRNNLKFSRRQSRSIARVLIRLKLHLPLSFLMTSLKGVSAIPTGPRLHIYDDEISNGFRSFWESKLTQFIDKMAGPLLYNAGISLTLTGVHIMVLKLHNGRWKHRSLLLSVTIGMCLGFFYLIMTEDLSGCQIVIWLFAASFLITYVKEKLADLQHTGIHAVTIVAPGVTVAAMLATYAEIDGRWPDRFTLTSIAVIPCIMASACLWTAFLHETNIIHRIDNGTYLTPILDLTGRILAVITVCNISIRRMLHEVLQIWEHEHPE